jgi:hypothetical protein
VEHHAAATRQGIATRLDKLAKALGDAGKGKALGTAAATALGISGPVGWGILAATTAGGLLVGRRMRRAKGAADWQPF